MNVWLIHLGELLPIDGKVRLMRYGILAEMLSERGHTVTRWAPTFVHATKTQRAMHDRSIEVNEMYRIELLYAEGYRRHVGLSRMRFHRQVARSFTRQAKEAPPPDLILCGMPTPEMCAAAIEYGAQRSIPVVIDVRDLWPDIFLDLIPSALQSVAKLALRPAFKLNERVFSAATGITAISDSYLEWGLRYAGRSKEKTDGVFYMGYRRASLSDLDRQKAEDNWRRHGISKDAFICCFFGTIGQQFDLDTILAAAKHLQEQGEDEFQFVICGDGARLPHFRDLARSLRNVVFPGWVNSADIAVLMEWSKVGLAPYGSHARMSLPNKPFEYLSGGLPILSSLGGELKSIIANHDCGVTYQPGDEQGLVTAIRGLRDNPERRTQMGENARRLFNQCYSADSVYGAMIDHLERIANDEFADDVKKR